MTDYAFPALPVVDPNDGTGALVAGADFQFYAYSDTSYASPLTVIARINGVPGATTSLRSNAQGLLDEFEVTDEWRVWAKSGSHAILLISTQGLAEAAESSRVAAESAQVAAEAAAAQAAGATGATTAQIDTHLGGSAAGLVPIVAAKANTASVVTLAGATVQTVSRDTTFTGAVTLPDGSVSPSKLSTTGASLGQGIVLGPSGWGPGEVAGTIENLSAYAAGAYQTRAGRIIDPLGNDFVPVGFRITVPSFGDNGSSLGRAADAVTKWGVSAVGLDVGVVTHPDTPSWYPTKARATTTTYLGESMPQWKADILARVDEYTAAGIVVVVTSRDSMQAISDGQGGEVAGSKGHLSMHDDIRNFYVDLARRYRTNPRVWINPHSEPPRSDQAWCDMHNKVIDAVRAEGYVGPIILDPPVAGQDLGLEGVQYYPAGRTWLQLVEADGVTGINDRTNIINGLHVYGWPTWQRTVAGLTAYVDNHRAEGYPVFFGEFGAITVGTVPGPDALTSDRAKAVRVAFDMIRGGTVGGLHWHGHENDDFSLLSPRNPFWNLGVGGVSLTWTGALLLEVIGAQK